MERKIKIWVVDDETLVRTALKKKLQEVGYRDVSEADDGKTVLSMLKYEIPDIIIADIRMVEMDGLTLLRKIREMDLNIVYILLSGFEVFDYAREAVKYNAAYYLLKPVDDQELFSVIKNAETLVLRKRAEREVKRTKEQKYQQNQNAARRQYLRQCVFHKSLDRKKLWEEYQIRFLYECFSVVLFQFGESNEEEPELGFFFIENVAEEVFKEQEISCWGFDSQQNFCLLCNLPERFLEDHSLQRIFLGMVKRIENFGRIHLDTFLLAGVGFAKKETYLKLAYQTAQQDLLQKREQEEDVRKMPYGKREQMGFPLEWRRDLKLALKQGTQTVTEMLEKIYTPCFYTFRGQKKILDNVNLQLIMLLLDYLRENGYDSGKILGDEFELYRECSGLRDEKETYHWMLGKALCCVRIKETGKSQEGELQEEILQYIECHYQEILALSDIATYFGMTPSYFSRLFKQMFGINYLKYLMNYRVEKAKQLLVSSDLKVYEIGQLTGFQDAKRFYKIFKNYTGYQPSAYREQFL